MRRLKHKYFIVALYDGKVVAERQVVCTRRGVRHTKAYRDICMYAGTSSDYVIEIREYTYEKR